MGLVLLPLPDDDRRDGLSRKTCFVQHVSGRKVLHLHAKAMISSPAESHSPHHDEGSYKGLGLGDPL